MVLHLGVHVLVLQPCHKILERRRDIAAQQLFVPVAHLLNLTDVRFQAVHLDLARLNLALQALDRPKRPVGKPDAFQ